MDQNIVFSILLTVENIAATVPMEEIPIVSSIIYKELYKIKLLSKNFNVKNKKIIDQIFDIFKIEEGMSYIKSIQNMNTSPDGPSFTYLGGQKGGKCGESCKSNDSCAKDDDECNNCEDEKCVQPGATTMPSPPPASGYDSQPPPSDLLIPSQNEAENIVALERISYQIRATKKITQYTTAIVDECQQLGLMMNDQVGLQMTATVLSESHAQGMQIEREIEAIKDEMELLNTRIQNNQQLLTDALSIFEQQKSAEADKAREEFQRRLKKFENSVWWKKVQEMVINPSIGAGVVGGTSYFASQLVNWAVSGVVWGGLSFFNILTYVSSNIPIIGTGVPNSGMFMGPNGECDGFTEYYVAPRGQECNEVPRRFLWGTDTVCTDGTEPHQCIPHGTGVVAIPESNQTVFVATFAVLGAGLGLLLGRAVGGRSAFADMQRPGLGQTLGHLAKGSISMGVWPALIAINHALTDSEDFRREKHMLGLERIQNLNDGDDDYIDEVNYRTIWLDRWQSKDGLGHTRYMQTLQLQTDIDDANNRMNKLLEHRQTLRVKLQEIATTAMNTVARVNESMSKSDVAKAEVMKKFIETRGDVAREMLQNSRDILSLQDKQRKNVDNMRHIARLTRGVDRAGESKYPRASESKDHGEGGNKRKRKRKRKKSTKKRRKVKRKKTKKRRRKRTKRKRRMNRKKTKKN